MDIVLYIFLGIIAFIAICFVLSLIDNISKYFKMRALKIAQEIDGNQSSSILEKLDFSLSIMDLIDRLINIEVEKKIASLNQLNMKYRVENFDIDIKEISDNVFKAIRPEVFKSPDMLIDSEYLMKTIVERSTYILIESGRTYNSNYVKIVPSPDDI